MKRIAITADSHCDQGRRFEQHNEIMAWIGRDAAERGASLYLNGGDIWERRSTSTERLAVADWVRDWTQHAPLVVVAGNHDDPNDTEWLGRLKTKHPVHAITMPEVVEIAGCSVACLPWPRKAHLLASLDGASVEAGDQAAVQALRAILLGLGQQLSGHGGPCLFLGHVQLSGAKPAPGQPPLVGCAFELGLADLALTGAAFSALGHIHLADAWSCDGAPVAYAGSPRACTFGETEVKSYLLVDFSDDGKLLNWERIATPSPPMVHLEAKWVDGKFASGLRPTESFDAISCVTNGAEVRFRYNVPSDQREAAARAAYEVRDSLLSVGVASVKLEQVVDVTTRARAPEVARALTLADQLSEYWTATGFDPGQRRAPLLSKLAELEAKNA